MVGGGFHHQASISKSNGSEIATDIFLDEKYQGISAILYSCVDLCNRPDKLGQDYIFIHNPFAKNPVKEGLLGVGREATVSIDSEVDYSIRWI